MIKTGKRMEMHWRVAERGSRGRNIQRNIMPKRGTATQNPFMVMNINQRKRELAIVPELWFFTDVG